MSNVQMSNLRFYNEQFESKERVCIRNNFTKVEILGLYLFSLQISNSTISRGSPGEVKKILSNSTISLGFPGKFKKNLGFSRGGI